MLAQAASGTDLPVVVPVITALAGIVAGALLSHLLGRRAWRIEARKNAYVQFVDAANWFHRRAVQVRFLLRDGVENPDGRLYAKLHKAFGDLRPAYYELELLAPARLARKAWDFFVDAEDFLRFVDPQGSGWGVDPPADPEDYETLFRIRGPNIEVVLGLVEGARLDLTVDSRTVRALHRVGDAARWVRHRFRRWRERRVGAD